MHKKLIVYYFRDIPAAVRSGINFLQIYYLTLKLAITAAEIRNTILQKYGTAVPRVGVGLITLSIFIAAKCQLLSMLAGVLLP
jgi:hypothetical protein